MKKMIPQLLLLILIQAASANNIAYLAKTGPETDAGTGTKWPANRFEAEASGSCITDKLTGLMWVRNASLLGHAKWGSSSTPATAQYKIDQMNTNAAAVGHHLCGYDDWRLPNIIELKSLINYSAKQNNNTPVSWLQNIAGFSDIQSVQYWSSTEYDSNNAWSIYFTEGYTDFHKAKSQELYIWPVRGGSK